MVIDDGGDVDVLVRVDPADDDDGHGCFSVHALGSPRLEVAGHFDASLAEAADKDSDGASGQALLRSRRRRAAGPNAKLVAKEDRNMADYLIENGRLLDVTGSQPSPNSSVFVEGNRIAKLGPKEMVKAFADKKGDYKTLDASGRTIMPGMIDCHVHPSYGDITSIEALEIYTAQ